MTDRELLKESRDLFVMCSLLDKSNQCNDMVNRIDEQLSTPCVVGQSGQLKDKAIPNIDDWIKAKGYTQISLSYVYKKEGTYKDKEELFKEYRKEFCL